MSKRVELTLGYVMLYASLVLWPVSMFTLARDEPPFVLSLSWLAITLTAWDIVKTSKVHKDQDK